MSKEAEDAHEIWWKAHLEECERTLIVGSKVYRVRSSEIEEGVLVERHRGFIDDGGWGKEDPNSKYTVYCAKFETDWDWDLQIYQWKWFSKLSDAQKILAKQLRDSAQDCRSDAQKWDALAEKYEKESAVKPTDVGMLGRI